MHRHSVVHLAPRRWLKWVVWQQGNKAGTDTGRAIVWAVHSGPNGLLLTIEDESFHDSLMTNPVPHSWSCLFLKGSCHFFFFFWTIFLASNWRWFRTRQLLDSSGFTGLSKEPQTRWEGATPGPQHKGSCWSGSWDHSANGFYTLLGWSTTRLHRIPPKKKPIYNIWSRDYGANSVLICSLSFSGT